MEGRRLKALNGLLASNERVSKRDLGDSFNRIRIVGGWYSRALDRRASHVLPPPVDDKIGKKLTAEPIEERHGHGHFATRTT
jgi:hypothetical protein